MHARESENSNEIEASPQCLLHIFLKVLEQFKFFFRERNVERIYFVSHFSKGNSEAQKL
jgi:hypothetical protein